MLLHQKIANQIWSFDLSDNGISGVVNGEIRSTHPSIRYRLEKDLRSIILCIQIAMTERERERESTEIMEILKEEKKAARLDKLEVRVKHLEWSASVIEMTSLRAELNQTKAKVKELQEREILILDTIIEPSTADLRADMSIVNLVVDTTLPRGTKKQLMDESDEIDEDALG
ncbi:hypothetical protein HAX54_051350 [Datura stramonium]|uniref:Uncharacterized protein n=1 Tax=Datura stramonium TaxID=4076 RepID=A0ABS8SY81_DATST|nr:hypothetical protein [Datura stramonium]